MEQLWRELYNKQYEESLMGYEDCRMLILRMFSVQTHGTNMTITISVHYVMFHSQNIFCLFVYDIKQFWVQCF
jgi:hypothetical protein